MPFDLGLLHERNWDDEYGDCQEKMLTNIREQIQRLSSESFSPKSS